MIIKGHLDLSYSDIESLGKLKWVKGHLDLNSSKIKDLGDLKQVKDILNLGDCKELTSLGKLERVKILYIDGCPNIKDLGKLKKVDKLRLDFLTENFSFNKIKTIQILSVGEIKNCKQINMDNLEKIETIYGSSEFFLYVKNLGKLKSLKSFQFDLSVCKDNRDFNYSSFGNVETIEGNLIISGSKNLKSLKPIKEVKGAIYLINCPNIKDLGYITDSNDRIRLENTGITKQYIENNHPNLIEKIIWD